IEINQTYAEAYCNRGLEYGRKGQSYQAIDDFNKSIELNPQSAKAYYNRAVVFCGMKEYDKAWQDIHQAQSLGFQAPAGFLQILRKDSGREK
ncbi:MAG: tetratricopeptide repeat protein, partial [Planctomycetota bacterium]